MKDVRKTIGSLIDRQSTAFIGSVSAEGFPNVKAMLAPRKRIGLKTMYFTSNTSSMRAAQYRDNPKACIFLRPAFFPRSHADRHHGSAGGQ